MESKVGKESLIGGIKKKWGLFLLFKQVIKI